ncbi:uncharacterized protein LOC109724242 [Ananas comosus]|uniref:Uncharacterized protein LOC109724242 n=1 Tax=Ananas comosus TaxID=4615 RepID=A0A6P5GRM1_ANACO|nr:uncharacterized protein LOC109724242 [Ananas comosus]
MALVAPLPSHSSLDYTILKSFVDLDPSRFILGPSLTDEPFPADFHFTSDGLPLRKATYLQYWYSSASTGKSLRTWPSISEPYLAWLDRVEAAFGDFWWEVGIYEAIELSRHPLIADNLLLAAALCFWSPASNIFLFRRGPLTPTLFDVAVIIGLRPHGVAVSTFYNPDGVSNFEAYLDPMTWPIPSLSTSLQKINCDFVPIAVGLSNGDRLALGPYFLAFVYREIFDFIKLLPSGDAAQFDSYGLALGCPQPMTSGQPSDFLTYFKTFYEPNPDSAISWAPFVDRLTGLSWFLARFEAIQGKLASSHTSEYSEVWYSYLASRDLHMGLKLRSKLLPNTDVYSPQYVARQFGFVQSIPAPSKFFTANTADYRPPTKGIAEADNISTMGNRLRRFFKLVSFRPNYTGVALEGYATIWDQFTDRIFDLALLRAA